MTDRDEGEIGHDQAPDASSSLGNGSPEDSGGKGRIPRNDGRVGDCERQPDHHSPTAKPLSAAEGLHGSRREGEQFVPGQDHSDPANFDGKAFGTIGKDSFTFQSGTGDPGSDVRDPGTNATEDEFFEDSSVGDESFEEDEESAFPFALLGELAANEKDLKLRKQLYTDLSRHIRIWHDRQHDYVCQIIKDRHRARLHGLKKFKIVRKLELRAGFGEMFGRMIERIAPVLQAFAEWALPSAMVFLLAKWMTSSYWMKSDEAARSLKELMVMIMAGALGWVARTSVNSSRRGKPDTVSEG